MTRLSGIGWPHKGSIYLSWNLVTLYTWNIQWGYQSVSSSHNLQNQSSKAISDKNVHEIV